MGNITYKSFKSSVRGKGKKKRLIATAQFFDAAHPDQPRIYNLSAMDNAIKDRQSQRDALLESVFCTSASDKQDLSTLSDSVRAECEAKLHTLNTDGLEYGRSIVLKEYERKGFFPPKSKRDYRQKRDNFIHG